MTAAFLDRAKRAQAGVRYWGAAAAVREGLIKRRRSQGGKRIDGKMLAAWGSHRQQACWGLNEVDGA